MKSKIDLSFLNDKQKEAVLSTEGVSLVIAGPGSGKTKVLTTKIAYLIVEKGVKPENILALTFTNKAANEMKKRINDIVDLDLRPLFIGTFHSCFSKILRLNCDKLGYKSNFTIYDSSDSRTLLNSIIKNFKLNPEVYSANQIAERISLLKSRLITHSLYKNDDACIAEDSKNKTPDFYKIYLDYEKKCKENNVMDFDDLLLNLYVLFSKNPKILETYQEKFKYILIDEFQDTNIVQYKIVKALMGKNKNLCAVGDDSQSIYSFRGSSVSNILNFKKDFKNCKEIKLEQNYRSTKHIVAVSNEIISKNKNRIPKKIWTENSEGEKCKVLHSKTGLEEAKLLSLLISKLVEEKKYNLSEMVILCRMNSQSRLIETELKNLGINYRIIGGISFYQREEIKDIFAFFKVILNPDDSEAIKRTINRPRRGIGDTTMEEVYQLVSRKKIKLWEAIDMSRIFFGMRIAELLQKYVNIVKPLMNQLDKKNAYEIAHELCDTAGFLKYYKELGTPEATSQYENINELLNSIKMFVDDKDNTDKSLSAYVQTLQLDQDANLKQEQASDDNTLSIMTVHSSKGLEFKCVFIAGLEEGIFPIYRTNSAEDLEEERRLFYVAVTRAKESLYFSYASARYHLGKNVEAKKSRFLEELGDSNLDKNLITINKFKNLNSKNNKDTSSYSMFKYSIVSRKINERNSVVQGDIKKGVEVFHSLYGKGKIINIAGNNGSVIKACFEGHGEKTLIKDQCKLVVFSE